MPTVAGQDTRTEARQEFLNTPDPVPTSTATSIPGPSPSPSPGPSAVPATGPSTPPAPVASPVSVIGISLMLGLLGLVLLVGVIRNGWGQAVSDLGFRSPTISIYTGLLLSPILFETLYPRLGWVKSLHARRVIDNLHAHAPYMIFIAIVMLVMRLENIFDLDIAAALGLDWTRHIYLIEGDIVARFQEALRHPLMDSFMRGVYVAVYALYHVVALVFFAATGRTTMVKRFAVTWTLIYAVALPFYILAPVNETWTTNPEYGCYPEGIDFATDTEGILHNECGDDGGLVLSISSINNCFPSLHNAFAWALPFLLWKSGWKRTGNAVAVVAFLISLSTLYLGIHWVTDLVAGVALAWGATWVASRFHYFLTPTLKLKGMAWKEASHDTDPKTHLGA